TTLVRTGATHSRRATRGALPALRVGRHRPGHPVRLHRLQVAAPLPRVQRTVRGGQAAMSSRTDFHPLTVARVDPLTDDSAAVTFAVPDALRSTFAFRPGQSLTVRRGDERRSYSICAPAGRAPRIGVREVVGGAVSGWL